MVGLVLGKEQAITEVNKRNAIVPFHCILYLVSI